MIDGNFGKQGYLNLLIDHGMEASDLWNKQNAMSCLFSLIGQDLLVVFDGKQGNTSPR